MAILTENHYDKVIKSIKHRKIWSTLFLDRPGFVKWGFVCPGLPFQLGRDWQLQSQKCFFLWQHPYPIGSMYAIYGNIYHQYTPNVTIYTIHGSYGIWPSHFMGFLHPVGSQDFARWMNQQRDHVLDRVSPSQWPFQEPKLEVPSIYKAYVRAM